MNLISIKIKIKRLSTPEDHGRIVWVGPYKVLINTVLSYSTVGLLQL